MPLSIIDYLIIFLSSIIGGMILAHLIIYIYSKLQRKPIALSYIGEKLEEIRHETETEIKKEEERIKIIPVLSELSLLKNAFTLGVFTIDELTKSTNEDENLVRLWVNSALKQSLVTKISEDTYLAMPNAVPLDKIQNIAQLIRDRHEFITQHSELLLSFRDKEKEHLAELGIKNIIYIGWDDDLGPKVDYFLHPTRFVKRIIDDPSYLARLVVGGEVSVIMESEHGDKIIIYKVERRDGERITPNNIIAEITSRANIDKIKAYLYEVKNSIERNESQELNIEGILRDTIKRI